MSDPTAEALQAAIASEQQIAVEAVEIRDGATELTPGLFLALYPLLCRPIPDGFIQTLPPTKGKPYESTGIRSVQVQIDRMNNVLTPLWWHDLVDYEHDGKVARVTVIVGDSQRPDQEPLVVRSSRGGVGQGSSAGNIYKGSYTNAAKLAFARLGPGHEIYLGAADLDPDVNEEVAGQPAAATEQPQGEGVGEDIAKALVERVWKVDGAKKNLQLAAGHVAGKDIGDCSTKSKATKALSGLTFDQAQRLENWVAEKEGD